MKISAMGKKSVVLGLAMCLVLSSFHEVSCQVGGSREFETFNGQEFQSDVKTLEKKATSSVSQSVETESEAASVNEVGQSSSGSDEVRRLMQGYNQQAGSDGVNKDAEIMDASEIGAKKRNQVEELEELQRQVKATASSQTFVQEEITKEKSQLETRETTFQGGEYTDDRSDIHQNTGENESEVNPKWMINEPKRVGNEAEVNPKWMINEPQITGNEAASMESRQQYESSQQYESKTSSSSSGIKESLAIGQSGAWRCFNQDKNGVKGEDSIVIPKYELNDIIKEESIKGSSSKTSSLITSLSEIVENHKKGRWTDVKVGEVTVKETSEKVKKLKATLKKYIGLKVRELVDRSDYEEILTMAARYEELTSASVTYISRLATYGTVIKEGFRASQRVQTFHQRVVLHENVAVEKQKRVDAEFELVKALAQKGDNLSVQIFAMKNMVLKLEAERKQVDVQFQKIVQNLSRVLEESSHAYEKHRVVVREWKEVQASADYSLETIEKAEVVWVQFLNTL